MLFDQDFVLFFYKTVASPSHLEHETCNNIAYLEEERNPLYFASNEGMRPTKSGQ